ncbi:uncharacterized protein LOC126577016 isoform X2 [Anopheles aquasalis]|uniref:uncharacterized protein LOC126577016 isoform X2 n=1 Tax=Anopheles aquasalis TaxID=42839 RepID=UPI00215A567B|nr:uncharacterized protein LOC126577016 isoform X2 [Anopheles aquasalis]
MKTKSKQKPDPGAGGSISNITTTTATTSGNSKPAETEEPAHATQQQQQQQQSNESESLRSNAKAPIGPSEEPTVSAVSSQRSIPNTTTSSSSTSASATASKTTTIAGSSQPEVAGDTSSSSAAAAAAVAASASASSRRRETGVRSAASASANAVNSRSKDQPPTGNSELPAAAATEGTAAAVTPADELPPAVNSSIEPQPQTPEEEGHTNEVGGNEPGLDPRVTGQDECDIIDFPLPELPVSSRQDPTSSDSFFTATDAEDGGAHDDDDDDDVKRSSKKSGKRDDKEPSREGQQQQQQQEVAGANMHYRTSANGGKPTYLFGENLKKNEIFLNKSGWVQVSGQPPLGAPGRPGPAAYQYGGAGGVSGTSGQIPEVAKVSRKYIEYDENRYAAGGRPGSKLEDLINRNDTRGKGMGPRGATSQHPQQQQQQQQQQFQKMQRQDNVTILKIDPSASSSLNNRPACLSIKRNLADGSPPPVTPILSPPPAFQDSQQQQQQQQQSNKTRLGDIKPGTRIFLSVVDNENHNPKGMVFSRSFEYDRRLNRRPPEQEERGIERAYSATSGSTGTSGGGAGGGTDAFSKSFDYDYGSPSSSGAGAGGGTGTTPTQQKQPLKSSLIRRTRSPTFATLTGNSPNYLTKKEKPATLSSPIFPKAIPGNSLTVNRAVLGYASSESLRKFDQNKSLDGGAVAGGHRSRRSQFSTKANSAPGLPYGFRSDSVGNQRLNSCDSGARSDYSNDDVDDDDDDDDEEISEDQSSSLALSYKSSTSYINQMKGRASGFGTSSPNQSQSGLLSAAGLTVGVPTHSLLKAQRSLTPERLYDNNMDEYGSVRNLKKQRSLTPEKRSRTPDDRSKRKGDPNNSSQSSLVSRQSSGSRSSTLERQQLRYDEGFMRTSSRSSSSSSYSGRGGDENVPATSPSNSYRQRGQLRGNVRHQPVTLGGDYKIRRSRSLQLSERSPSRQQMPVQQMPHKVVVRLGTMPPKERPAYTTGASIIGPNRAKGATPLPQMLSHDSLMAGGLLYSRISPSSTLDRLRRETASNTLEVVDKSKSFDNNNYGHSSGSLTGVTGLPYTEYAEFDKSKSFDDNLGHGPGTDRDKRTYVTNEKRSYSHDRVFGSTGTSSSNEYTGTSQSSSSRQQQQQQRSPQTSLYGGLNRMYDPEIHRATMARSPVMMGAGYRSSSAHHRGHTVSRERSPVPGQGTGRYQPPTELYLMRQQTPDSEYDSERLTPDYGVASEGPVASGPVTTFKEAELVKKFLYATKNKIQMHRESAGRSSTVAHPPSSSLTTGTPSSGSCTASSCDFWPHCGVSSAGATAAATTTATATAAASSAQLHQQQQQIGDTVPQQHQLPKSGSENCLGRKVKRSAVDSIGGSDCVVVGPGRANGTGAGGGGSGIIVGIGAIGSVGSFGGGGGGGGGTGSSSSSHASHISSSNGTGSTSLLWSSSPKAPGNECVSSPRGHRAMPVPVKANSYGGVSCYGHQQDQQHHQQQQQQHHPHPQQAKHQPQQQQQQQRVLRKQQNFEFYDDDGAGPLSYRMSAGPSTTKQAYGSPNDQPGPPPGSIISTIIKANSITFLGEHEMPITRDRASSSVGGGKGKQQQQGSAGTTGSHSPVVGLNGGAGNGNTSTVTSTMAGSINNGLSKSATSRVNRYNSNSSSSSIAGGRQQKQHPALTTDRGEQHGKACTGGTGNEMRDGRPRSSSSSARSRTSGVSTSGGGGGALLPAGSIKRKVEMKLKSRSLPKSFMRYSNLTTDDVELSAILTSKTPLQLRAVSSPSLSEAPVETASSQVGGNSNDDDRQQHLNGTPSGATISNSGQRSNGTEQKTAHLTKAATTQASHHHPPAQVSESVLQRFRKTFSHFKSSKSAASPVSGGVVTVPDPQNTGSSMSVDDKQPLHTQQPQQHPVQSAAQQRQETHHHHRFGPLIWRSSKERRKTKSHRRDKCNSGDSGIQVELDNDADQQLLLHHLHPLEQRTDDATESAVRNGDLPHSGAPVRRANSAKVSTSSGATSISSSILRHKLSLKGKDKENVGNGGSRLSGKSLSQPSGLDCIVGSGPECCDAGEARRRRRRQHTRTATTIPVDLDLSDSESISSHPDEDEAHGEDEEDLEPVFAEVLFSFRPVGPQELVLEKGALMEVLKREPGPWWWGRVKSDAILTPRTNELLNRSATNGERCDGKSSECGWFPKDYVKIVPTYAKPKQIIIIDNSDGGKQQDGDDDGGSSASTLIDCDSRLQGPAAPSVHDSSTDGSAPDGRIPSHNLTKENIIKELLETEINYVKLLNSLCLGFIKPLREREDIFSVESVNLMFSNLEKIWRFQQTFLDALRLAVPNNRIGEVFLEYQSAFMVYSSYCNSYPRALMELENYANNKEANQILESCRIAENLPELPLSAHLLAPIQRICRYPLHLSELVKHSSTRKELLPTLNLRKCTKSELETMDCKEVFEMALSAMRRVTEMVNEGKRHSEYLSRIQARFENFQGPSINLHSTRLFLQTDAIRMSPNLWNNTYTLFLFDRQLIYCKKDLLKRTNYIYKGRIFLDNCRILNLPDGKMFGVTLKNALRLYCDTRNKWFDFCFRSSSSKLRFLNTLSTERQFCGESLFVSELDGGGGGGTGSCCEDDNLSDREYFPYVDDSKDVMTGSVGLSDGSSDLWELGTDNGSSFRPSMASSVSSISGSTVTTNKESLQKQHGMGPPPGASSGVAVGAGSGNTLPKKSRKMPKEAILQQQQQQQQMGSEYGSNSLGRRKLGNWFRKAKSTNSTPSQSPTHHPMAMSLAAIGSNTHSDSSSASSLVGGMGGYQQRTLSTLSNSNVAGAKDDDDNDELLF